MDGQRHQSINMVKCEKDSASPPAALNIEQPKIQKKKTRDGLHVHPRGSETRPTKVSCAACISGHRSGDCSHFDRILLKIRAAGRPSQTCHHQTSCGGSCLTAKAYIVPGEIPEWCTVHRSCIINWEVSDTSPPYPITTKRKQRSPSPVLEQAKKPLDAPPPPCHGSQPKPAMKSCCSSSVKEPWQDSTLPSPLVPVHTHLIASAGYMPPSSTAFDGLPSFQPFQATGGAQTPISVHSHAVTSAELVTRAPSEYYTALDGPPGLANVAELPNFDFGNTYGWHQTNHDLVGHMHSGHGSTGHRDDAPPPQKRNCPGNGYQCPCENDSNCQCAQCYTHGHGLYELVNRHATHEESESEYTELPPTELLMERNHVEHETLAESRSSTISGAANEESIRMWQSAEDDGHDEIFPGLDFLLDSQYPYVSF